MCTSEVLSASFDLGKPFSPLPYALSLFSKMLGFQELPLPQAIFWSLAVVVSISCVIAQCAISFVDFARDPVFYNVETLQRDPCWCPSLPSPSVSGRSWTETPLWRRHLMIYLMAFQLVNHAEEPHLGIRLALRPPLQANKAKSRLVQWTANLAEHLYSIWCG